MWEDDEDKTEDIDRVFDEIDNLVEQAKRSIKRSGNSNRRFKAGLEAITYMMEEVPSYQDIELDKQADGRWVAQVKYHGILFEHVAGTVKPPEWEEILGNDDDDDDNDESDE